MCLLGFLQPADQEHHSPGALIDEPNGLEKRNSSKSVLPNLIYKTPVSLQGFFFSFKYSKNQDFEAFLLFTAHREEQLLEGE